MIPVNDKSYNEIAEKLLEAIGQGEYYNGTVEYECEEYSAALRCTLLVYREPLFDESAPAGAARLITDIVPVWWEFHTFNIGGEEINDFEWQNLRHFLL
ncbi:hypothetical protein LJC45_05160 [Alistipes sp. OttesenSCG-928-B03]|nr:hypothetical protein [Alistipes sp. OttesenSCG-928-B03]